MFLQVLFSSIPSQLASVIGHNVNGSLATAWVFHFSTTQFYRICISSTVTRNAETTKHQGSV